MMDDKARPSHFSLSPDDIQPPPTNPLGIVRRLGPGLIIAAAIVGSGELIATTTLALSAGASFYEAAQLATYACGSVVQKRGTATVSSEELRHAVATDLGG